MDKKVDTPEQQVIASKVESLNRLIEEGKKAAEDGQLEEAYRKALQAMVGAGEAKDSYLREERSPYTNRQLADWFGTIAFIFNSTGKHMNAARCFYTATAFDDNWTAEEHVRVGGVLWRGIMVAKTDEFRNNFQALLSFLHEVEEAASLAERLQRWAVASKVSLDIYGILDQFVRIHRVGANNKQKSKISREALMRVARCGLHLGEHQVVKKFCHKVLDEFSDYNDPEAFEVWGKSLIKVNDYQTAQKKIKLALENSKSGAAVERLEHLLNDINEHLRKPPENEEADPDWLEGTEAVKHQQLQASVKAAKEASKKKSKHRRPKAKERPPIPTPGKETSQTEQNESKEGVLIYSRQGDIEDCDYAPITGQKRPITAQGLTEVKMSPRNKKGRRCQRRKGNLLLQENEQSDVTSIASCPIDLSDFDSDTDSDETSLSHTSNLSDNFSVMSLEDTEAEPDDENASFYEASCRFYGDRGDEEDTEAPKDTNLIREGLQLNASFLDSIRCSQRKEKNESFYEPPLDITQCEQKLLRQPKQFKRCSIQIEGPHLSFCSPIKCDEKISVIAISGRSKAGRTFNEDEVAVEILDVAHEDKDKRFGKVVGILNRERHKGVDHPVFVCTLDDMESHLVRPMCKTVPKINILHNEIRKHFFKERKNKIELYEYNHRDGTLDLERIIDINPADRNRYVFLVAFLQWERQQYSIYPYGAVIRILPCGDTLRHGLKILDLQHDAPSLYRAATVRRVESLRRRQQDEPAESLTYDRHDLTHLETFTIDPPGSKDLDDALSIEKIEDGFCVGVHIADVSVYVQKGDAVDIEARERAVSFYPGVRKPRHMLPEPLSQNICSLLPDKRRLCISVFHYLDGEGESIKTEIKLSVIKSRRQLTYAEAQKIIKADSCETGISESLRHLYRLAEKRRKRRLGNAMYALDLETDDLEDNLEDTREAHFLVEEFMVLTNWKVAKHLVNTFKDLVPQRCQPPPSQESLDYFMKKESSILNLVLKLQGKNPFSQPSLDAALGTNADNYIMVQKWLWDLIFNSPEKASRCIKMDKLQPLQYLAYQHWLSIQEHAFYKCSGSMKGRTDGEHFSLGYAPYTHFTSPIRRYIDIIVHRLIHCMIKKEKMTTYTTDEVERICLHLNAIGKRSKAYEKGCKTLKMAIDLKTSPKAITCFTDDVSDKGVSLCAPELRFVAKIYRELAFNLLDMGFKPEELEDTKTGNAIIKGKWRKRLYDFTGWPALPSAFTRDTLQLDPHLGIVFVRAYDWAKILKCVIEGRLTDLQTTARYARCFHSDKGHADINTEVDDISKIQPSTTFSLTFTRGQVLKIQMTAEAQKGILAPKPQLLNVTKSFKCCLQHTDDPVKHLTSYSTKSTLDQYSGVRSYLSRWLPLVLMEAAVSAVSSEDTCTINSVPVKFRGRSGKFSLPLSFCELRNIEFGGCIDEGDEDEDISKMTFNFLCLKYMTKDQPSNENKQLYTVPHCFWVGHGDITKVCRKKDAEITSHVSKKNGQTVMEKVTTVSDEGKVIVSFDLHPLSADPPMEDADDNGLLRCGIEILTKSQVDRLTESFLKKLPEAKCPLAERIAMNNRPFDDLDQEHTHIAELMERDLYIPPADDVRPLPRNNIRQQEAIDKALGSRFTLIQGPPGTGKTYTGIKLLYLFNKINSVWRREGNEKKQVLFCGPSNKSVDLVARWMIQRLGQLCPKVVRVYGRSIEAVEFPIPGRSFLSKRSTLNAKADDELKSISLHHLIRKKGNKFAERIKEFDMKFKKTNYAVVPRDVKEYLKFVHDASVEELTNHEVILCTTTVASGPKIRQGAKIFQIIIDEAGMCPEPQCLVPIIANKAEQVVLIGDHKQLRPIIMCKEAAELGLEKSLFEKYWLSESARGVKKIMLNIQYRMNPQLCRFPSGTFYNGKLLTESGLWQQGRILDIWTNRDQKFYPHVLIHVEGEEKVLTVSTEDGNEQSKSNIAEIDEVIRIFGYLINDQSIPASQVNIISQYNAQCSEIKRRLEEEKFYNFKVHTVVSSQGGEWDYVIFSTVRSLPEYKIEHKPTLGWCKQNLGFITDQNQINVALTRARKGLIIIGNTNLLKCDEVWGKLVRHYEERGCIKMSGEFPPKRTRQQKMAANIEMSEQRYGDERFVRGNLPDLEPYMPADDETRSERSYRPRYKRSGSREQNTETDDGWQQARPRRKFRY